MSREKLQKARERFAKDTAVELERDVKTFREELFTSIMDIVIGFSLSEDGAFNFNTTNITRGVRVNSLVETQTAIFNNKFIRKVIKKASKLLGLNKKYIRSMKDYNPSVDDQVVRTILLRLGYDNKKKDLVRNGWLDSLTRSASTSIGQTIAQNMSAALSGGVTLKSFRKEFKSAFTSKSVGYPEHHYNTFTFDLFQTIDRETNKAYADKLGINYFLYSGTLKDNSRQFCIDRVLRYYSRSFIETWVDLEFQGKFKVGYNPFAHCGGHRCRHHLSAITKETLEILGELENVDKYN